MDEFRYIVTETNEEERVDKFVTAIMDSQSRSYIQRLMKEGKLTVNGMPVRANYRLHAADEILFCLPEAVEPEIAPEDIELDVLFEDQDVLVVNKPKGMVVHPAAGHYSHTLVNAVMHHCKGNLSGINGIMRPGIVHRIDMNTTGSIIVCKNDIAHASIAGQLKDHTITRKYRAIVHGDIKNDCGTISAPIGRHRTDRKKMAVNTEGGKQAVTHYRVLEHFRQYSFIECELETGRTHQIRVHMASIGHPIVGDDVYTNLKPPVKLQGQTLHAMVLGFIHPVSKLYIEVLAPLPEYFVKLLTIL